MGIRVEYQAYILRLALARQSLSGIRHENPFTILWVQTGRNRNGGTPYRPHIPDENWAHNRPLMS